MHRVTNIVQVTLELFLEANLIHLSIKIAMPHQSEAPFVGERVFQNRGFCGQAFPSFPLPHPALSTFLLSPHFSRGPNFVCVARERLLRRLEEGKINVVVRIKREQGKKAENLSGKKLLMHSKVKIV